MSVRDSKVRRVWQWADVRRRNLGMWAYVLNRLSGLGLVAYLYLHLIVLSTLARGPAAWDAFVATARLPIFLALDVILLTGLLLHGFNGVRVALNGFGIAVRAHKALFIGLMAVALVSAAVGGYFIFIQ